MFEHLRKGNIQKSAMVENARREKEMERKKGEGEGNGPPFVPYLDNTLSKSSLEYSLFYSASDKSQAFAFT